MPLITDGRLLPLAIVPNRTPLFPNVPALSEALPGAGRDGSQMRLPPAGTPRAILQQISKGGQNSFCFAHAAAREPHHTAWAQNSVPTLRLLFVFIELLPLTP